MDNYAAHERVEIRDWLAANPRVQAQFTPTSASWMNMVEIWFGWNDRAHPFVWTKTTDQILAKAKRPTTTPSGHFSLAPNRVPRGGGDP